MTTKEDRVGRAPHGMEGLLNAVDETQARGPKEGSFNSDSPPPISNSTRALPVTAAKQAVAAPWGDRQEAAQCLVSMSMCVGRKGAAENNAARILSGMANNRGRNLTDSSDNSLEDSPDMTSAVIALYGLHKQPSLHDSEDEEEAKDMGAIICHGNHYRDSKLLGNAIWMLKGREDPSRFAHPDDPPPTLDDHKGELECLRCAKFARTKTGRKDKRVRTVRQRNEREQTVPVNPDAEDDVAERRGGAARYSDTHHAIESMTPLKGRELRAHKRWLGAHAKSVEFGDESDNEETEDDDDERGIEHRDRFLSQFTDRTPPTTPTVADASQKPAPPKRKQGASTSLAQVSIPPAPIPLPLPKPTQPSWRKHTKSHHYGSYTPYWSFTQYQKEIGVPEDIHNTKKFGAWITEFVRSGFKPTVRSPSPELKNKSRAKAKPGWGLSTKSMSKSKEITARPPEKPPTSHRRRLPPITSIAPSLPPKPPTQNRPSPLSALITTTTTSISITSDAAWMSGALSSPSPPPPPNKKRKSSMPTVDDTSNFMLAPTMEKRKKRRRAASTAAASNAERRGERGMHMLLRNRD